MPSALASSTQIKVEVLPNGDAHWTTEKMIPLDTPGDVAGWDATAAQGTDGYRSDFDSKMKDYVAGISSAIHRPMSVTNVNVSVEKAHPYTISGNSSTTYGIITYEFTWTDFAMAIGDSLEIGDSFADGFLLNDGDSITFVLPSGYDIQGVSPAPYDEKLFYQPQIKWSNTGNNTGARLFASGEPYIILRKEPTPLLSLDWWMLIPVSLLSAAIGFGVAYSIFRRPSSRAPIEIPSVRESVPVPDAGNEPLELPELDEGRYMSDEERVIMFLEESGGQMFQSDLVKKTDFSKSKLSMVLSVLKEKGTIVKIKKGKENLIRLNRPSDDKPDSDDTPGPDEPET